MKINGLRGTPSRLPILYGVVKVSTGYEEHEERG